jgi:hypothetical protein
MILMCKSKQNNRKWNDFSLNYRLFSKFFREKGDGYDFFDYLCSKTKTMDILHIIAVVILVVAGIVIYKHKQQ